MKGNARNPLSYITMESPMSYLLRRNEMQSPHVYILPQTVLEKVIITSRKYYHVTNSNANI